MPFIFIDPKQLTAMHRHVVPTRAVLDTGTGGPPATKGEGYNSEGFPSTPMGV